MITDIEGPDDKLFTIRQVAQMFEVTPYTIRHWLTLGELVGTKIGPGQGLWRITKGEIVRYANKKYGGKVK